MEVEIQDHDGYIHAVITGQNEVGSSLEILEKVLVHSGKTKVPSILYDSREVTGKLSTGEIYEFSTKGIGIWMKNFLSGKIRKVKIVFLMSEQNFDPNRFGENIASGRGIDFVLTTTDHDEAMKFLGISS